jgi:hypothetical protein
MVSRLAFSTDDRTDRELASNGRSRYEAYLAQRRRAFCDDDVPTTNRVDFALAAWSIAGSPIMAPGYVSSHPRIQGTEVHWDYDHRAAIAVHIAVPAPPAADRLQSRWRSWSCDYAIPRWYDPFDNDRVTALATLVVRVPLDPERLPVPDYRSDGAPDIDTAKIAVGAICRHLNAELADLLDALDGVVPS